MFFFVFVDYVWCWFWFVFCLVVLGFNMIVLYDVISYYTYWLVWFCGWVGLLFGGCWWLWVCLMCLVVVLLFCVGLVCLMIVLLWFA